MTGRRQATARGVANKVAVARLRRIERVALLLVGALLVCGQQIRCGSRKTEDTHTDPHESQALFVKPVAARPRPEPGPLPPPLDNFPDCNIVLVSFDALQASHLGSHGYPRDTTPTLDALAAQSYQFGHAMSVASWTVPASMTWFTGVYPSEHGMTNKFAVYSAREKKQAVLKDLAPELRTLAEILRDAGYATGGFTGNAGVAGGFGYQQGFDEYYFEPGKFGGFDASVPRAIDWVRAHRDRKFFLFLHGYDVHGQYVPQSGLDFRFVDRKYDGRYTGTEREQEILREQGLERGHSRVRPTDVEFWRAVYDEKVQRADARFREFLNEFAALGLMDRTLFIVTSDHGTELCEHGRFDHGFTLYNELLHVPLIIKTPGQTRGRWLDQRVSSLDLMPTLLALAAIDVPEATRRQLRGVSLIDVMNGGRHARDVIAETDYRAYTYRRAIIAPDGWKLIYALESDTRELFDLTHDPFELQDRSRDHADIADALQERLFEHYRQLGHDLRSRPWRVGLNPVYASQGKDSP